MTKLDSLESRVCLSATPLDIQATALPDGNIEIEVTRTSLSHEGIATIEFSGEAVEEGVVQAPEALSVQFEAGQTQARVTLLPDVVQDATLPIGESVNLVLTARMQSQLQNTAIDILIDRVDDDPPPAEPDPNEQVTMSPDCNPRIKITGRREDVQRVIDEINRTAEDDNSPAVLEQIGAGDRPGT